MNELETFDTRKDIQEGRLNVGVGALSVAIAVLGNGRYSFLARMTYMLNAVVLPLHGMVMGKRRRKLEERFSFSGNALLESD